MNATLAKAHSGLASGAWRRTSWLSEGIVLPTARIGQGGKSAHGHVGQLPTSRKLTVPAAPFHALPSFRGAQKAGEEVRKAGVDFGACQGIYSWA